MQVPLISISFDDGWKNHYTRALPILNKFGFMATFFVITQMPSFMLSEGEGRMTPDEWVLLQDAGHEIGSHTRTHPFLTATLPLKLRREVRGSRFDLENLGIKATTFAYPYGRHHYFVRREVVRAGYTAARAYDNHFNYPATMTPFVLHSIKIVSTTTIEEIKMKLHELKEKKLWAIFTFHQIEPNPGAWGTTPELFEQFCQLVADSGIPVLPICVSMETI